MTKIIDLQSRFPKNSTVAVIDRNTEKLIAFLSKETTEKRYSFTEKIGNMSVITEQEAKEMIIDLNATCALDGIRTLNEDTNTWSITPMSEIKFVTALVEIEK